MMDTIELLEAIGQNASLRHASPQALAMALEHANASPALTSAASTGDSAHLREEFGDIDLFPPQVIQTFATRL